MNNNAPDYENNLAFDPDINTMPRCDIEALKSEIKHLKDLQNEQDKEVEELRDLIRIWYKLLKNDLWHYAQFPDGNSLVSFYFLNSYSHTFTVFTYMYMELYYFYNN